MVTPLMQVETLATPDYGMLVLADADADAWDPDLVSATLQHVVAGNGYQLYIGSRQSQIPVRVVMVVWPHDPHRTFDDAEGTALTTLFCASGRLLLREMTRDVPGDWQLPATGRYEVSVGWKGRDAVHNIAHSGEPIDHTAVDGYEEYRLDLWLSANQEEDEDED